jgi:hypothetical protein
MRRMPRRLLLIFLCTAAAVQAADYDPYIPSCYRYGRCESYDLRDERLRQQRLERLAPNAPEPQRQRGMSRRDVPATPAEEVHPAYRTSGEVREEFQRSGAALNQ